jgi:hypothetical protein
METFEDLQDVIDTVAFDSEALIERAVADGRRRQRRHRMAAGAGVLAVGAVVAGVGLHSPGPSTAHDPSVARRTTPSKDAGHHHGQKAGPGDGGKRLPTPQLADARLVALLPEPGHLVSASVDHGVVVVRRTLDPDGSGKGAVTLTLQVEHPPSKLDVSRGLAKCDRVAQVHAPSTCVHLSDGWMFIYRGRPDVDGVTAGAVEWKADVFRTDGSGVTLSATNYLDPSHRTRQVPPLTMAQLEHLATDSVWFEPAS